MITPVFICHQLRSPDNLGAIARVMANFGLRELVLSDPQTHDFRGVEKVGVKADHVLARFAIAASLEEALSGVVYAVGTTSRTQLKRFSVLSPEAGIARRIDGGSFPGFGVAVREDDYPGLAMAILIYALVTAELTVLRVHAGPGPIATAAPVAVHLRRRVTD